MSDSGLTPQEYELHTADLCERLKAYLERGEGDLGKLLKEAEEILSLAEQFPDVGERHPELEGLVAETLARRQQRKFMPADIALFMICAKSEMPSSRTH